MAEPANRGETPVDSGRSQTALLELAAVQLDVRSGGLEDVEVKSGGPLEVAAQVMAVGVERAVPLASWERCFSSELGTLPRARLAGSVR